jgi:hypothetical protein
VQVETGVYPDYFYTPRSAKVVAFILSCGNAIR